jgi:hypothetical protein
MSKDSSEYDALPEWQKQLIALQENPPPDASLEREFLLRFALTVIRLAHWAVKDSFPNTPLSKNDIGRVSDLCQVPHNRPPECGASAVPARGAIHSAPGQLRASC